MFTAEQIDHPDRRIPQHRPVYHDVFALVQFDQAFRIRFVTALKNTVFKTAVQHARSGNRHIPDALPEQRPVHHGVAVYIHPVAALQADQPWAMNARAEIVSAILPRGFRLRRIEKQTQRPAVVAHFEGILTGLRQPENIALRGLVAAHAPAERTNDGGTLLFQGQNAHLCLPFAVETNHGGNFRIFYIALVKPDFCERDGRDPRRIHRTFPSVQKDPVIFG